jgi:hypothetical protein
MQRFILSGARQLKQDCSLSYLCRIGSISRWTAIYLGIKIRCPNRFAQRAVPILIKLIINSVHNDQCKFIGPGKNCLMV